MLRSQGRNQEGAEACATLIVRCLRDILRDRVGLTTVGAVPEDAPDLLPDVAAHHRVAPAVRCALRPGQLPTEVDQRMAALERGTRLRHLTAISDLAWLGSTLGAHTGDWVVFKGPILSQVVYQRPDLRSYADLDVLVRPRAFERILDDLIEGGAVLLDDSWEVIRDSRRAQVSLRLPAGNLLDLHWHVVNHPDARAAFCISTDEMIDRQRQVAVAPLSLPTFDAIDTVLHLALHASMHGGHRLVWLLDLAEAMRHVTDCDQLAERVERLHVALPVGVMLRRTRRVLGTSRPPADVVRRLLGAGAWPRLLGVTERLRPPARSFQPRQPSARMLTVVTRRDTASSLGELVRAVRELRDPSHPWRRSGPGLATVPSPRRPRAGAVQPRSEYFQYIASYADR